MYVAVTGTIGSGKGEVVRILRRYGFTHYSFGDLLRKELTERSIPVTVAAQASFANAERAAHGADYFAKRLLRQCEADAPRHAVFESVRTVAELQVLRKLPKLLLIAVDAPRELRFEREQARGRVDKSQSFEEFAALEDAQLEGRAHEQQLLDVMDQADIKIVNIGNLEELEQQLREDLQLKNA